MQLLKNSFDDINIEKDDSVFIIDQFFEGSGSKTIVVGEGATVHYLILMRETAEMNLRVESAGEGANIIIKGLLLGKADSSVKLVSHAHLMNNHATADLHLVSLLQDGSTCEVDGGVDLHAGCSKISGHLLEENIILGDKVKIKTLPMLDVRSSDVSASHGCKISKLDDKKMFYMMSKGLSKKQAEQLMIQGYIEQMFADITASDENNEEVETIAKECMEYILG